MVKYFKIICLTRTKNDSIINISICLSIMKNQGTLYFLKKVKSGDNIIKN